MDWRSIPSLLALRAFEAAARTGSLSEAARELNVTHAAIAQHLRTVEKHLGVTLMQREGRGMAVTEPGRALSMPLTEAFERIAEAVDVVTATEAARPLAVTLTPSFAAKWLMPRLGAFWKAHPDIPLSLHPNRRSVDLARDGMDLAIRFGTGGWSGLESELLVSAKFSVVGAPSLLGERTRLTPAELTALPWIIEEQWPEQFLWMRQMGIETDQIESKPVPTEELALSATRQGYGLHVESSALIADDIEAGTLRAVFEGPSSELGYYLVTRPGHAKPALKTFVRWLKSVA